MRTHIDWLTFTMTPEYPDDTHEGYAQALERAFTSMFGNDLTSKAFGGTWERRERSRAPYVDAWSMNNDTVTLFASPMLTHCCIEISGKGCEALIAKGLLQQALKCAKDRVTRIDIASDIETDVKPREFVEQTTSKRMRSGGYQVSDKGETCYVGSQKSDRYARVYRYNPPHPRGHLLRVEHVFRRDYARQVVKAVLASGEDAVAAAAGKAFGWAHNVWHSEGANEDAIMDIVGAQRGGKNTIGWLVTSVAPAIKRLVADGTIRDPERFFEAHFLP